MKARQNTLTDALEKISVRFKLKDECSAAQFYASNYDNIMHTCQSEPDLPHFRDLPDQINWEARVDMASLDQFLNKMEAVNFTLETMNGSGGGYQRPTQAA